MSISVSVHFPIPSPPEVLSLNGAALLIQKLGHAESLHVLSVHDPRTYVDAPFGELRVAEVR
jgi:hypothetical protein